MAILFILLAFLFLALFAIAGFEFIIQKRQEKKFFDTLEDS